MYGAMRQRALLLLLVLVWHICVATTAQAKWPDRLPVSPDEVFRKVKSVSPWQEQLLQALWDQDKDSMGYCLGTDLQDAKRLLRESFPDPLPTGPADDPLCSNTSLVMAHLCTPKEVQFWFKVRCSTAGHAPQPPCHASAQRDVCLASHVSCMLTSAHKRVALHTVCSPVSTLAAC
jgi:hypothetical protein